MYNHNLEMIQTYGQENSMLPFECSLAINLFLVSNQFFIIYEPLIDDDDDDNDDHDIVTIINRSNGLVESCFVILNDFDQMKLYLDKFLLTFNNDTCILKCYNFKGDLLHKITLDKKLEGSDISVINKELCFDFSNGNFFIF